MITITIMRALRQRRNLTMTGTKVNKEAEAEAVGDGGVEPKNSYKTERHLVVFICLIFFPLLSIVLVGGYGFLIWISQMIFGPPGA